MDLVLTRGREGVKNPYVHAPSVRRDENSADVFLTLSSPIMMASDSRSSSVNICVAYPEAYFQNEDTDFFTASTALSAISSVLSSNSCEI